MKKNCEFVLREIAGQAVLVPFGDNAIDFNGLITLNETAKFMWKKIDGEIDTMALKNALIHEYKIDDTTAENAVKAFIDQLKEAGCIDE